VDLTGRAAGKVHAIMGPNGSGKSTLSYVLSGRDGYEVHDLKKRDPQGCRPDRRGRQGARDHLGVDAELRASGRDGYEVEMGEDLLEMEPESARRRACSWRSSTRRDPRRRQHDLPAHGAERPAQGARRGGGQRGRFPQAVREKAKDLKIDADMLKRPVNVGFSGGEKKRNEILQMALLEPKMCILDETDSGLDVDAMKLVADGVNALRSRGARVPRHHPLPAASRPHPARCRAHHVRRAHREDGRPRAGARGREERLCRHPRGGGVMALPKRSWT
jgi:Fe-S cluster assembly ATP-binding protein